jgi:hypothetical protein
MESEEIEIVTTEFQKVIQGLIDNLEAEQFRDAEEYKLALKYDSLPIGLDLFSYVFLNSNGEVIWDDNEGDVGSSNDLQSLIRVLVAGKRRYPQLTKFIPNRFDESKTCLICNGSGIWKQSKDLLTGKPGKCFFCAGLGWITNETYSEILKNSK